MNHKKTTMTVVGVVVVPMGAKGGMGFVQI